MIVPLPARKVVLAAATVTKVAWAAPARVQLSVVNAGANAVSLGPGPLAENEGETLNPLGGVVLHDRNNPWPGAMYAYSTLGTTLSIQETQEVWGG